MRKLNFITCVKKVSVWYSQKYASSIKYSYNYFQGNCDFDSHLCFWRNNVNFNFEWTLRRYSTPNVRTGPKADHTSGTVQKKG